MRLINPVTGLPVDAQGEAAEMLKARGFTPEEAPKQAPKKAPAKRRTAPKKTE